MAGTIVEWYEFFLYAAAATLVFNKIFFPPSEDPFENIIKAFLTYAVGFVSRPVGGVIFGHFGDKYGRKKLLQVAIILVGSTTFLMGCLPTYGKVGLIAPILLVVLRFLQGIAVGGEWGGAILLAAEHSPRKERGFWSSWPQAALPIGALMATGVLLVLSWALDDHAFLSWGWRVGFWLSVIIVAIGYYIRTKITDAAIFQEAKAEVETEAAGKPVSSLAEVLRHYPGRVVTAMGLRFSENILYYVAVTFSITYLSTHMHKNTSIILLLILGAHAVHAASLPAFGRLSDRVGRKPIFVLGVVLTAVWGFVAFPAFNTGSDGLVLLAITSGLIIHALMYATEPALMAEMFPTRVRYTGVSLGYQVTSIFAGSMAPIIGTLLLSRFGSWVPIAIYISAGAVVTGVATVFLHETRGISLYELDQADRARRAAGSDVPEGPNGAEPISVR
ncbi:MFS transporter [Nocardia sp. NPDC004168]|uniref:MFS transporter n=1 Tax=Nocardia sp. NPDC004168 TaxID=3154452 RepID=UPI0033A2205C